MPPAIDDDGYPLYLHLHQSFRASEPAFILLSDDCKEQFFRQQYEGLPKDARSLWCAVARSEDIPFPGKDWEKLSEEVKEFWRLRALDQGPPWSDYEKNTMDDPGYMLFYRRHENAMAYHQSILDLRGYNRTLPELWADSHWALKNLWRCDATGMLPPLIEPTTDPVKLWGDYRTVHGELKSTREDHMYGLMKEMSDWDQSFFKNFWVLKALALQESDSARFQDQATELALPILPPFIPGYSPLDAHQQTNEYAQDTEETSQGTTKPASSNLPKKLHLSMTQLDHYFYTGRPVECPCGASYRETAGLNQHYTRSGCKLRKPKERIETYRWPCPDEECQYDTPSTKAMMLHLQNVHDVDYGNRSTSSR